MNCTNADIKKNHNLNLLGACFFIWVLILIALWYHNGNTILELRLSDPDNYLRFVQVFRWIDGAAWYDVSQPRMNPPTGVEMHWSRFPDLLIALILKAVESLGYNRETATIAAAIIVPATLFLVLLLSAGWMAQPIIGRVNQPRAILVLAMSIPLFSQFVFGRVDHHSWQLIFTALSFGALLRMLIFPTKLAPAVIAAIASAMAMWTGVEAIPWLIAFCLTLCLHWILNGTQANKSATVFSGVLFAVSIVLLVVTRAPGNRLTQVCDAYSISHVAITGTVFMFWMLLLLLSPHTKTIVQRISAAILNGIASLNILLMLVPDCPGEPFGDIDPQLAELWLPNISEARSLIELAKIKPSTIPLWIASPLIAIVIGLKLSFQKRGKSRLMWTTCVIYGCISLSLGIWQLRFFPFAHLFAVIPLAWLLSKFWRWSGQHHRGWRRLMFRLGSVLLVGPLPWIAVASLASTEDKPTDNTRCAILAMGETLTKQGHYPESPKVIATFMSPGAELLFRTPHTVVSANYHRNWKGVQHVFHLFSAANDEKALAIISDHKIELVMLCPSGHEMQFYRNKSHSTFAERLVNGEIPDWLQPIAVPAQSDQLLFEVINTIN